MAGIFAAHKEAALTMQQGGGVGCDFSTLRPRGSAVQTLGGTASGPVSFMHVWNTMCDTLLSTGNRRGAMMATLRCDHPNIEHYIGAKQNSSSLRNFNLSVLVTGTFTEALAENDDWALVFPDVGNSSTGEFVLRTWPGYEGPVRCRVHRRLPARELWQSLMRATFDYAGAVLWR